MEQVKWEALSIGTDVQADRHQHTDLNTFKRSELAVGRYVSQSNLDGSDVFGSVKVVAMDDYSITVRYGIYNYTLTAGKYQHLDRGGRDYATFDLWIALE